MSLQDDGQIKVNKKIVYERKHDQVLGNDIKRG